MSGKTSGMSARTAGRIKVERLQVEKLAALDLDVFHYAGKWAQAQQLAKKHPALLGVGWSYWRVVRQLFVELGGLPFCWQDDEGRALPDDHPDRRPWNPWPWWLDPERWKEERALLVGAFQKVVAKGMSDVLPNAVPTDYTT